MVQVGRRRDQAGRQPVRDRDRQGVDGGALDLRRRARRDSRGGGRGRAGRRRRRRHRGRGGAAAAAERDRPPARHPPPKPAPAATGAPPGRRPAPVRPAASLARRRRRRRRRSSSTRSSRCARPSATMVPRGCPAAPASRRWRGGSPRRAASTSPASRRRARTAASVARDVETALASGKRAAPACRRPVRRPDQGALPRRAVRGGAARRHAPDHRRAAGAGDADHPAFLPDRRRRDRRRSSGCARRRTRPRPRTRTAIPRFKLSVNDFVIKAWAAALQRVPAANAVWAEDRILRFKHSDIGVAVAIEGGLITPVIRQRGHENAVGDLARDEGARRRAREQRKLKPDEYQGGASAISNLGMYGVREFSAIINPPQATILAVGAARRQAVETADGGVAFASVMSVTLSCDHRVVDGALGARAARGVQGMRRATRHDAGVGRQRWLPKRPTSC